MFISLIIPTINRAKTLKITLSSILKQTDLEGFEVIIIDNGSKDETKTICADFIQVSIPKFKYYHDSEPGLLTGRHLGTSLANGDILCFLDDDVELNPNWISGVKDAFINSEVQLATGPCLPKYEVEPPSWLKYFWRKERVQGISCSWLSLMDLGNQKKSVEPNNVWGLNFCIRKATLILLGGFHPDNIPAYLQFFQGDGETGLTLKAKLLGYKAFYHPQLKLHHLVSAEKLTVEYFKKRAFYQGVCDSFTCLRKKYSKDKEKNNFKAIYFIKMHLQPAKNFVSFIKLLLAPKEVRDLMAILLQKEKDGFNFHQAAFKNDFKVRNWVLKQNYWDYKLPR